MTFYAPAVSKVRVLRDLYNSHGEIFALADAILKCQPGSTPNTVILTRKDEPGYPFMAFSDDVEPVESQP